ncbi:patatin-like phospholipase family protein [Kaarinaea lacus]
MDNADNKNNKPEDYVPYESGDMEYFGAVKIIQDEQKYILKRRQLDNKPRKEQTDYLTNKVAGLSLSGGGIRSASFCVGVLQALSYNRWLKNIDYLSTVSGGGYIGSSLTWLLSRKWEGIKVGVDRNNFPYGTYPMIGQEPRAVLDEKAQATTVEPDQRYRGALLRFLRQHGKYLTPGRGINVMSLLGVVLRGSILSVFVYFSLLVLVFALIGQHFLFTAPPAEFVNLLPNNLANSPLNYSLTISLLAIAIFVVLSIGYSLSAFFFSQRMGESTGSVSQVHQSGGRLSYRLRRWSEKSYNYLLTTALAFLLIGLIPVVYGQLGGSAEQTSDTAGLTGLLSTLLGFVTSIATFLKTSRIKPSKIPLGLLVAVSTLTLWFGLFLLAYHCMLKINGDMAAIYSLGIATLLVGLLANLNYISIHRYYRDRLMEVFMPDLVEVVKQKKSPSGASAEADKARLSDMCWYKAVMNQSAPATLDTNLMPYHIINSNIVLVSSKISKFRGRGGDNFILTPAYCGSNATGWATTSTFMKGRITLSTAMAISGAAVNPSTGVGGDGVTRQPLLSMLMGLLNIRLGYWVTNPDPDKKPSFTNIPNFFLPGLSEMALRKNLNEDSRFLQLSDGGHFENLALYELIRRKTKLIIVCDGAADPDYKFTDLSNALEKIRADFGVLMTVNARHLHELVPIKDKDNDLMAYARQGYIIADILYPGRKPGKFIYIKSSFFSELSADLYGYKQKQPEFPDEPTSDQFFDEKQFEAYRELGYQTAWRMMENDSVKNDSVVKSIFGHSEKQTNTD